MWIRLPNGLYLNLDTVTDFYPSNQYKLIRFETIKPQHNIECHFNTEEERDKYLDKLRTLIEATDLNETIKL